MPRRPTARTATRGPGPNDWAARYFARGWHGCAPWVVLERRWASQRRLARAEATLTPGFAFDLLSYRVLSAPALEVYADDKTARRIIAAFRAHARRLAVDGAVPADGAPPPLTDTTFRSPLLFAIRDRRSRTDVLLDAPFSLDPVVERLVADRALNVDQALSLLIVFTCHGTPGPNMTGMAPDAIAALWRARGQSTFLRPFHPDRFGAVRAAIRVRCADDSAQAQDAELFRMLVFHVPGAIQSLRAKPPRRGASLLAAVRSRLVELVSADLGLPQRPRTPPLGWTTLEALTPAQRRRYARQLTPAEREVLRAVRRTRRIPPGRSTVRVHLRNAKVKYHKLLAESPA